VISITAAQFDVWIAALICPLVRILGMVAVAPVFNNAAAPRRIRLMAGLAITLGIAPALPAMPAIPAGSWVGLLMIGQEFLIGTLFGLALRIAFAAVDLAGELIGLQMGLSFAVFYDPQNSGQTPVVSEFFGLLATLIYLALNGHLLSLALLAESFTLLPVSPTPFAARGLGVYLSWAATLFSSGILLALPLVTALLIANIAMGVLSRVAPQLNLFAVGFPVTMISGMIVIGISLPYFAAALERLFDQSFVAMMAIARAAGAG
jgi:flagellar biosynthetic protein FliR